MLGRPKQAVNRIKRAVRKLLEASQRLTLWKKQDYYITGVKSVGPIQELWAICKLIGGLLRDTILGPF